MHSKGESDMAYQAVFKRYEIKYLITAEQKEIILKAMQPYMEPDRFGRSTIRNIYFDTDDYILARHSIAKPDFKEKLRVRSYERADEGSMVFVELKRKYDRVVYKRRIGLAEQDAMKWMAGAQVKTADGSAQVANEIDWFLGTYKGLRPALFLSYDREAFRMRKDAAGSGAGEDFRVTFDENVLCRDFDISLCSEAYGESILEPGMVLMELKCSGGIPMWMTEVLSAERIYKTSFSKYGTAYRTMIFPALEEERRTHAAAAEMQETAVVRTPEKKASYSQRRSPRGSYGKHAKPRRLPHFGLGHSRATA